MPPSTCNALPWISEVAGAPDDDSGDLEDLRMLLGEHNVLKGVPPRPAHEYGNYEVHYLYLGNIAILLAA